MAANDMLSWDGGAGAGGGGRCRETAPQVIQISTLWPGDHTSLTVNHRVIDQGPLAEVHG